LAVMTSLIYNLIARLFGGIEITVADEATKLRVR
jgi:hypothetical protein